MGFGGIGVDAEGFKLGEFAETFVSVIVECCHDMYYNIIKKYERIQIYYFGRNLVACLGLIPEYSQLAVAKLTEITYLQFSLCLYRQ